MSGETPLRRKIEAVKERKQNENEKSKRGENARQETGKRKSGRGKKTAGTPFDLSTFPVATETEPPKKFVVTSKSKAKVLKKKKAVKLIFLGGVGEIGKNMTAIEYGNDIIVVDAGLTFPNGEDMPGIDSVVPDITYLAQIKDKVRAVFLTHGHEDHIGGVPYLM